MNVEHIKEAIKKINNRRRIVNIIFVFIITLYIFIGGYFLVLNGKTFDIILFLFLLIFFGFNFWMMFIYFSGKDKEKLSNLDQEYKENVVTKCLNNTFKDAVIDYNKGFTKEELESWGALVKGESFKSYNYINAKYKDYLFEFSMVHILDKTDRPLNAGYKRNSFDADYYGKWLKLTFDKKFKYDVVITKGTHEFFVKNMNLIECDSLFSIYTNASDISDMISNDFIKKLENLYNILNKAGLTLYFKDNFLYIVLSDDRDLFRFNIKNYNDMDIILKNDINIITTLMDEININNKMFK